MNIQNFCDHVGSKITMTKTQCFLLGNLNDRYEEISGIKRTNDMATCLGIYIGHNKSQRNKLNCMEQTLRRYGKTF